MKRLSLILLLSCFLPGLFAQSFKPIDPQATKEAKQLLKYLYQQQGKTLISGHHDYNREINQYTGRIYQITGELPAIWGCDLSYLSGDHGQKVVEAVIRKHAQGHIITLMWHVGRPQDEPPYPWKESVQAEMADKEWAALFDPYSDIHRRWLAQVDRIAGFLKQIQDAKVPILWRPYHEMNGIWFWWGDRPGADGFARLWNMLYDRLVDHHQLHNLIWVWNPNAPRDRENDEAYAYEDYFPGLDKVDILAADVYHNDYKQSHHDDLLALGEGKLIALGEVGEVPTPEILDQQPMWSWFMCWANWVDKANTPEGIRALYAYPKTANRNEIQPLKWMK
jgi:mannan endo-1,4-beta-mannosidase